MYPVDFGFILDIIIVNLRFLRSEEYHMPLGHDRRRFASLEIKVSLSCGDIQQLIIVSSFRVGRFDNGSRMYAVISAVVDFYGDGKILHIRVLIIYICYVDIHGILVHGSLR